MSQRKAEAVDTVVIGNHFVNYYYSKLTLVPSELHLFYQEQSSFSHGYENKGPTSLFVGPQNIKEKIASLNYQDSSVSISVIDVQPSHDGGIIVLVMGFLSLKDQRPKKFAETFFLVAQGSTNYFVLNHIFRFIDEDSLEFLSQEAGAEETQPPKIDEAVEESNNEPEVKEEVPEEPKPAPKVEATPEVLAPAAVSSPAPAAAVAPVPSTPPPTPVTAPAVESNAEASASTQKAAPRGKTDGASGEANESKPKGRGGQGKKEKNESHKPESNGGSQKTSAPKSNSWASIAAKTPAEGATPQESPVAAPKTTPAPAPKPAAPKTAAPAQGASNGEGKPKSNASREREQPKSLYISNIPFSSTPEEINDIFAKFGAIKNIDIRSVKGFGFIEYVDPSHGNAAIESAKNNPINVKGRVLGVEERRPLKGGNTPRGRPKVQGAAQ